MTTNSSGIVISIVTLAVIGAGFGVHASMPESLDMSVQQGAVLCSNSTLSDPQIEAYAAYVVDTTTGTVLYEKNAHIPLPLASLTKLMTALIAGDTLDTTGIVSISSEALTPEGNSGFSIDELWRVSDLIDYTLMTSSNDGAHALALAVREKDEAEQGRDNFDFVRAMNSRASKLGMSQTFFLNDTGLDVSSTTAGAYGSARDVSVLLKHAYSDASKTFSNSIVKEETFYSVSGNEYRAEHTSDIVGGLPGGVIAKTGFTDLAGGNLGVVAEPIPGTPVAIVVLRSSVEGRDKDVHTLYTYAKDTLKRNILCDSSHTYGN